MLLSTSRIYDICCEMGAEPVAKNIVQTDQNAHYRLKILYCLMTRGYKFELLEDDSVRCDGKVIGLDHFDQHPHWIGR